MQIEEIASIINNVESKYSVDDWSLDGIPIWPFIRIENYSLLSYNALQSPPLNTRSSSYIFKILKSKIAVILAELIDYKKEIEPKATDIVFLSEGVFYVKLNNKWYHKFSDPIAAEFLSRGYTSFRFDLSHNFFVPRYSPSKFIQTYIDDIIIKSLIRVKFSKKRFASEVWGDYDDFLSDTFVKENFLSIPSKEKIRARMAKVIRLKAYYIKKLKRINPKIAFVVNYYGDDQLAFNLACKDLNIITIDIQHGVQGELHLAYGRWAKVPKSGYPQLPDFFWVWSENEKKAIDLWNKELNTHKALVGGNLFGDMWKDSSSAIVTDFDRKLTEAKLCKERPTILLTLSPYTEELMAETWEVVKSTQSEYNWFIRLHPSMVKNIRSIKQEIIRKGISNFEMEVSSRLPLYSILRNVDIHVTCQSSCVIEASDFNVQSIITSEYGQSLYKDEIEKGNAYFCKSVKQITEKITPILDQKRSLGGRGSQLDKKNEIFDYLITLVNNNECDDSLKYSNA